MGRKRLTAGYLERIDEQTIIYVLESSAESPQTIAEADTLLDDFRAFLDYKKTYLITDIRNMKAHLPKPVREHLVEQMGHYLLGSAIVIGSGISKIVGNLVFAFTKPQFPRRLFTSRDEALQWLQHLQSNT